MAEPQAYLWTFDRQVSRPSAGHPVDSYLTFSVGIYQWLPKASGKGLKRSPAACRVLGYVDEPDAVFEKAEAVCARLNAEQVKVEQRPVWLQKQYSMPRPADVALRVRDGLSSSQVRQIRLRVMKKHLLPVGFVKADAGTYIRQSGNQIHLIDFQASKYGDDFTVNLGFHYTFLQPLFHRKPIRLSQFHLLDCILSARIGHFLPDHRDTWFEYGDDPKALESTLIRCVDECLRIFSNGGAAWQNPAKILAVQSESDTPWRLHDRHLAIAELFVCLGRIKDAESHLEDWKRNWRTNVDAPTYDRLIAELEARRQQPPKSISPHELPSWLLPPESERTA